jgi:hypothetical protein
LNSSNSKDGGWGYFLMIFLNGIEQVIICVINSLKL